MKPAALLQPLRISHDTKRNRQQETEATTNRNLKSLLRRALSLGPAYMPEFRSRESEFCPHGPQGTKVQAGSENRLLAAGWLQVKRCCRLAGWLVQLCTSSATSSETSR